MSIAPAPEAHHDALFVVDRLASVAGGATDHEVTLFCYLACLLSVYRGEPPSAWGYRFAATSTYSPYSDDISSAVEQMLEVGLLVRSKEGLTLSESGSLETRMYAELRRFKVRFEYLDAACASTTAMPLPRVGESINAEPQLRRAFQLASTRPLLDEAGTAAIMAHFSALRGAFPAEADLFIPALAWLAYLARQVDARMAMQQDEDGEF